MPKVNKGVDAIKIIINHEEGSATKYTPFEVQGNGGDVCAGSRRP